MRGLTTIVRLLLFRSATPPLCPRLFLVGWLFTYLTIAFYAQLRGHIFNGMALSSYPHRYS